MDDLTKGGDSLREALRHLRRLNRIFGASGPAFFGVKRLWELSEQPGELTILDIGSGSGDINRRLLRWADRQGVRIRIILADVAEEARLEAESLFRKEPRISFVKRDVFELQPGSADIVTASQFVHHFPSERIMPLMERMLDISRMGVVVNDIHRHWIPWAAVWLATRLVSRNPYIRHDGPLSVAKGFRGADFRKLSGMMANSHLQYRWRPLFRYAVIITKRQEAVANAEGV